MYDICPFLLVSLVVRSLQHEASPKGVFVDFVVKVVSTYRHL